MMRDPTNRKLVIGLSVMHAGRGLEALIERLAKACTSASGIGFALAIADAYPGAAAAAVSKARALGMETFVMPDDKEAMQYSAIVWPPVLISTSAAPFGTLALVQMCREHGAVAIVQFRFTTPPPKSTHHGVSVLLMPHDDATFNEVVRLLETLAEITPRANGRDESNKTVRPENLTEEPLVRDAFAAFVTNAVVILTTDPSNVASCMEIVTREKRSQLIVLDHRTGWKATGEITAEAVSRQDVFVRAGTSIGVLEVGPGPGLRLAFIKSRITDGTLYCDGVEQNNNAGNVGRSGDTTMSRLASPELSE